MLQDFLNEVHDPAVLWPLLGSLLAGALIGSERESHGKAAGLRTHTLVCFAAALMTLLGLRMDEWLADLPANMQLVSDMSRMPHAILTGVGFLGAGVIFRDGFGVQGLTTAATLWLTAALGVVFGTGLMGLAALGTGIALVVLVVLGFVQRRGASLREARVKITVPLPTRLDLDMLKGLLHEQELNLLSFSFEEDFTAAERRYTLHVSTRETVYPLAPLMRSLQNHVELRTFAFSDNMHD